jgi:hypothetical protein
MQLSLSGSLGSEMRYSYTPVVFQKLKVAELVYESLSRLLTEWVVGSVEDNRPRLLTTKKWGILV